MTGAAYPPGSAAHAGYLVDTLTGEVLRELATAMACQRCSAPIARSGRTGRLPTYCKPCRADRRRADARLGMRRTRARRDAQIAVDYARAWWESAPRDDDDRWFARHILAGDAVPEDLLDQAPDGTKSDGTAQPRNPFGWRTSHGPDEGWTADRIAHTLAQRHREAMQHPWWLEHRDWQRVPADAADRPAA